MVKQEEAGSRINGYWIYVDWIQKWVEVPLMSFGYVNKMNEDWMAKQIYGVNGSRRKGRLRKSWLDEVDENLRKRGEKFKELKAIYETVYMCDVKQG